MRWCIVLGALAGSLVSCAAASTREEPTTPASTDAPSSSGRFDALEGAAAELDPAAVEALPEVAEGERFFILDAPLGEVDFDEATHRLTLTPPASWVIGSGDDGQEIRLDVLEPDGGAATVELESAPEDGADLSVTWIVRYARRNVLLTEDGASVSVHVVPVAARLSADGVGVADWLADEASSAP